MVKKGIIIGDKIYKSQKECDNDVREKLFAIGITKNVKGISIDAYNYFIELCKRHPRYEEKLKHIDNFEIKNDILCTKGLALNILNKDGTTTEISWKKCVTGKDKDNKQMYSMALRQIISSQIQTYREQEDTDTNTCTMCNVCLTNKKYHVDHIIHFAKLVSDFTQLHNIPIPNEYDKKPITFEKLFVQKDKWIGKLFYDYHLANANLRIVCEKCNLSREKYKE